MDLRTLHKLAQRLGNRRIQSGDEADARGKVLADIHAAGIDTTAAQNLDRDALASMPGHTLLLWAVDADVAAHFFLLPDAEIGERMRTALDAIDGLEFATPLDCSLFQYAGAVRTLAAVGLAEEPDHEAFHERWVEEVRAELSGDRDLQFLPSIDELEAVWGRWRAHHVGRNTLPTEAMDRRYTHVVAVEQQPRPAG